MERKINVPNIGVVDHVDDKQNGVQIKTRAHIECLDLISNETMCF